MTEHIPMQRWFAPVPMLIDVAPITLTNLLGRWQLTHAHEYIEYQARIMALENASAQRVIAQPVTANSVMYRPALLRGTLNMAYTMLFENRPHVTNDVSYPGFEVFIPLMLGGAGGHAMLVDRGWLPYDPADRTRITPYATSVGEVQVEGMTVPYANRIFSLSSKDGVNETGQRLRRSTDLDVFSREVGMPLQPSVVQQQLDVEDGLLRDWPRADLGAECNYGYVFQRFTTAVAVLGLMIFYSVWRYRHSISTSEPA